MTTTTLRGPSAATIQRLKNEGYSVHMIIDQDPVLYGWMQHGGVANQGQHKALMPYRTTKAQAWADCEAYASCNMPDKAEADWNDPPLVTPSAQAQ